MSSARHPFATLALAAGLVAVAMPAAEAHSCRRLNKTQGAIIGGTVLGAVLTGGVTGAVIGAAAGGIAGHEIARKKHHKCYRARSR